jgi:hypothetical protein
VYSWRAGAIMCCDVGDMVIGNVAYRYVVNRYMACRCMEVDRWNLSSSPPWILGVPVPSCVVMWVIVYRGSRELASSGRACSSTGGSEVFIDFGQSQWRPNRHTQTI